MPLKSKLILAVLAALALPGVASAGIASAVTRDVPLGDARTLAASAPERFHLVGVTWRGPGTVEIRVRSTTGRWSAWMPASPEADAPDSGTAEARARPGWRLGSPWWVGPSDRVRFRTTGRVVALRATYVTSPESRLPLRRPSAAVSPAVVPRASWGADESIRRNEPETAPTIRLAVVHHTAGTNDYTQAQAAAIVRGIQVYHVKSNGWNDIGYNFLVDRFGTVYEGRYGGIAENVIGAHAQGFNTGSVGVAVLGTYETGGISSAAEASLAELLAWRLDLAHVDPLSTLSYLSNGNPRYPAGLPVFLRAVSGHRDTGQTSCPGDTLYARLDAIAKRVQGTGLPKLYEPLAEGSVGGPVRVTARLSSPSAWTVRVVDDATQAEVATGTGTGTAVDWTWDATLAPAGAYSWRVEAGATVTPASGAVTGAVREVELAFSSATADLETISPNGDGQADATTITYTLTGNANVRVDVIDAGGVPVAAVEPPRWRRGGERTVAFDGLGLPDGFYIVRLTARAAADAEITADVNVAITRTLGNLTVEPALFAPLAPSRPKTVGVTFSLAQPAEVDVKLLREGRWVANLFSGLLAEGPQRIEWNGTKERGTVADGNYEVRVEASDPIGRTRLEAAFVRDTAAPQVRLVSRKPAVLLVGEAARMTGVVNNARRAWTVRGPGKVRIPGIREIRSATLFARDEAGNLTELRLRADG